MQLSFCFTYDVGRHGFGSMLGRLVVFAGLSDVECLVESKPIDLGERWGNSSHGRGSCSSLYGETRTPQVPSVAYQCGNCSGRLGQEAYTLLRSAHGRWAGGTGGPVVRHAASINSAPVTCPADTQ